MKKHFTKIIMALAVAVIASAFVTVRGVNAEGGVSMFVSPMTTRLLLKPGEKYDGIVTVSNSADAAEDLEYSVEVGSYGLSAGDGDDDYSGGVDVVTETNYNMIKNWITVDKENGVVAPNGNEHINYTISVPSDAPAGAQYASILVVNNSMSKDRDGDGGVNIKNKYQIASAIIANVAGETVEKASITENAMPSVLTTGNLEATSMVKNEGNIYTDANYTLQVWPLFSNEEICTNEEKAETSLILPNTERYHVQSCELPMVGIFRAKQVVSIFNEESVLEKTIIVCPVWLMVLILAIIIAIIIAVIVIIRKNSKKSRQE